MHREPAGPRRPRSQDQARRPGTAGTRRASAAMVALMGVIVVLVLALVAGWRPIPAGPAAGAGGPPIGDATSPSITASGSAAATPVAGSPAPSPVASPSATPIPSESPASQPSATPSPIPSARLQAKLDKVRARDSVPGVSVAIVWDDGRTWTGVSGDADVAAGVPITRDSGFALASISKTFTAAVVLQLVEEGRLRLDQRVAPLLPDYQLNRRITVRMLLDHTSGLPDFFFNPTIDAQLQGAPDATWTPQESWALVTGKRPRPGTVWAYSNTNYLLLGELVQAVTGHPLATEIRQRLLDPLGLRDTWYQAVEKPRTPLTRGYRVRTLKGGGVRMTAVAPASPVMPFRSVITAAGGAGSIASTALDTARWMQAYAGGHVLTPSMQAQMLADVAHTRALHARIPYGLGIQEVTLDGYTALGHSGRYLGYQNVVRYLPDEGVTIAVLTNQNEYDPAKIARALLRIVLPPAPTAPSPGASASPSPGVIPSAQP